MRRMIAAAAIAVSAALAAGCASSSPAPDPPPHGRPCRRCAPRTARWFRRVRPANSPAPVLTGAMQSAAATAVREGSAIGLVDRTAARA